MALVGCAESAILPPLAEVGGDAHDASMSHDAILRPVAVFTPNDFPVHTYIERGDASLERAMLSALETPNAVISVSGPSKSGKTVLAEKIIGADNLINVSGAELSSANDLWDRVFDQLDVPTSSSSTVTKTNTTGGSAEAGGKGGIPYFAELNTKGAVTHSRASADAAGEVRTRFGMAQAERLLANTRRVIFIDDFHYMDRSVQAAVAKQIRAASGRGIKFCVASVPHRSDDVVRSNHELRGRTTHIDTSFWSVDDLMKIGKTGFSLLLMDVPDEALKDLATEACGSPQLMQQICLQACMYLGVEMKLDRASRIPISKREQAAILQIASTHTDYSSLLRELHTGPRTRGTNRAKHKLVDGSSGDAYRAVLLGLAVGPPELELPYARLLERTNAVCTSTKPASSGITNAVEKMSETARKMYSDQRIIEWDNSGSAGHLSLVDPYLLFYIRNSNKLASLGGV